MVNAFRTQLYIVYFRCTNAEGQHSTADCITEAMTGIQAKSQVVASLKAQGFRQITLTDCRLATESDLKQLADMVAANLHNAPGVKALH